jgi:hypothetical protein
VDGLVSGLPVVTLDSNDSRLIATGRRVPVSNPAGLYRIYGLGGQFIGLGEVLDGVLLPKRLMAGI